jgi:hypothetical protein
MHTHTVARRLVAFGAAALVAAAPVVVTSATSARAAATTLTASNFRLAKTATASTAIGMLDTALPNVSVATVVGSANRDMNPCASGLPHAVKSWCWQSDDANTTSWYPQGVSSSADAYAEATYDGKQVLLTSWYDHADDGIEKGTRVSFIDASDPTDPDYRHVLLVEPYVRSDGKASFRAVPVHAGGIAWYGYYLYVVDTWNGLRVFDMRHLWQVTTGDTTNIGLQSNGSYQAFDYQYVLPQAFRYDASTAGGYPAFRHSSIALDRSSAPDSIVMTEYRNATDEANGQKARVVRFPIDYTDRLLTTGSDGLAHATQAYDVDTNSLQGGIAVNGRFYFSQSDGDSNNGDLLRFTPSNTFAWFYDDLPIGTEDLSYWGPRDELWTVGEHPGKRSVVAVRLSAYTG